MKLPLAATTAALLFLLNFAGRAQAAPAPGAVSASASILMYHHIAAAPRNLAPGDQQYFVEPAAFDRQLFYLLSNGYNVVPLASVVDALTGGMPLPPKAVAITIDDGWQDFWQNGLNIVKKYAVPVTIFAIADADKDPYMSPPERWALDHSGVDVEAHSLTHPYLTKLLPAIANGEVANSRKSLEKELSLPVLLFAYPYGDSNKAVQAMVQAAGYRAAFAAGPANDEDSRNLLQLPRVMVSAFDTLDTFGMKASDYRWARTHALPLPAAPPRLAPVTVTAPLTGVPAAPPATSSPAETESPTRLLDDVPDGSMPPG